MLATFAVRLITLIVLAIMFAGAFAAWRRAIRNPFFLPARTRKAPIGRLRIACGILGGLILVAISLTTWQTVHSSYALAAAQINPMVHAPALPAPPQPPMQGPLPQPLATARLLVTVTVLDAHVPDFKPVAVAQTEMTWPLQKKRSLTFDCQGTLCQYDLSVKAVQMGRPLVRPQDRKVGATASEYDEAAPPQLQVVRGEGVRPVNRLGYMFGWGEGPAVVGKQNLMNETGYLDSTRWQDNPLSITRPLPRHYFITSVFTILQPEDPLASVRLLNFLPPLSEHSQYWWRAWTSPFNMYAPTYYVSGMDPRSMADQFKARTHGTPGAFGLFEHLGISSLLLIFSVVLLTQLFRRRDLALAGLLLAMVLFVVAWDRGMLAYDLSRVNDPNAPLAIRLAGCTRVSTTFFYGRTARMAMRQVKDNSTGSLQSCADVALTVLDNVN